MKNRDISYCKIFPAIGIARIGDSDNSSKDEGWFIGPEFDNDKRAEGFKFKDSKGRIKRQAARFRVYAFDKNHKPLKEITAADADITWTVQLANKKASWFSFLGTNKAMHAFRGDRKKMPETIRNPKHGRIDVSKNNMYKPSAERAAFLEIIAPALSIKGTNVDEGYEFHGKFKGSLAVYLGELRTDAAGNLIVLGGHGNSDAINDKGQNVDDDQIPFKSKRWIRNYANNDDWYDDISDGPVTAEITIGDKTMKARDGAWIVVAPPDFAPDIENVVTLYDVMEEVATKNPKLITETTPDINTSQTVYADEIKQILMRMHSQRWISARALRGHGGGKSGDFQKGNQNGTEIDEDLFKIDSERGRQIRGRIFSVIRKPAYCIIEKDKVVDRYEGNKLAVQQATSTFMPPLAGDEGDPEMGNASTWLSLTDIQYEKFEKWSKDNFSNDPTPMPNGLKLLIDSLTRNSLKNCAGGAFYPGIEMTCVSRDPLLYCEAFRLNHDLLEPGDVSKYMAVPWQADFWECQQHWWPAQRPDDIIPDEEFEEIFSEFKDDASGNYERVLFNRIRWDRGLGNKSRPSNAYLRERILPTVDGTTTTSAYIDFLCTGKSTKIINVKFDSLTSLFNRLAGAGGYAGLMGSPTDDASKLPSPWRLQYTAQEALDAYSGIYFHLVVPSPYVVLDKSLKALSKFRPIASEDIRREWSTMRLSDPAKASAILGTYATAIQQAIQDQVKTTLMSIPAANGSLADFRKFLGKSVGSIEGANVYSEIAEGSEVHCNLACLQMVENAIDYLYILATDKSGDMDMVNDWKKMGFVIKNTKSFGDTQNTVQTEINRSRYDGKSFRDYFYYLMNVDEFPDFIPYSKHIVEDILGYACEIVEDPSIFDTQHPESYVPYSKVSFPAKLNEIYEILWQQAAGAEGFRTKRTHAEWTRLHLDSAPFNQTDGAWLRFIANAGPSDEVASLLFEVWSDEYGNGNPALHHGNLFTQLLASFGLSLPPTNSRAYVDNPDIPEIRFIQPVFQLAISQHSQAYFPELLGMTLFLEWEVLSLVPGVKGRDFMGIDSHFWQMHVGIDNASNGHGAKARQAIEIYLDTIAKDGGDQAVQAEWKRIWTGFVAFASAGYGYFSNKNDFDSQRVDIDLTRKHQDSPQDRIKALMVRKAAYGSLNHAGKAMGGFRINDLFDEPDMFVDKLANSPYITAGRPEKSKLLDHLTTFEGPMYKVFNDKDLQLWKDWVIWLGREGDTTAQKKYLSKAESMFVLMNELRSLAQSSIGHKRHKIESAARPKKNSAGKKIAIAEFFESGDLKELMSALRQPDNGWVVPYDPTASPMVVELARANRPMGIALDRRFEKLSNQIGRVVLISWIEAGCPLIGEQVLAKKKAAPAKEWNGQQLLVQQIGLGAVH